MISLVIICIDNKGQNVTMIFNILDNTTELWMTKYIIGEIFSSGGVTLYKNSSDQTVFTYHVTKSVSLSHTKSVSSVLRKKLHT